MLGDASGNGWKYARAGLGLLGPQTSDLISYVTERRELGVGRTFYGTFQAALVVMEEAGQVRSDDRLSLSPMWEAFFEVLGGRGISGGIMESRSGFRSCDSGGAGAYDHQRREGKQCSFACVDLIGCGLDDPSLR